MQSAWARQDVLLDVLGFSRSRNAASRRVVTRRHPLAGLPLDHLVEHPVSASFPKDAVKAILMDMSGNLAQYPIEVAWWWWRWPIRS
eukprot:753747-Prymnesium_polylepis.1